jgi:hypothetical protein
MAGSYPDVPGRRMAYDDDGCVFVWTEGPSGASEIDIPAGGNGSERWRENYAASDLQELNNEDTANIPDLARTGAGTNDQGSVWCIIFPELRDIDGWYANGQSWSGSRWWIYDSADTTSGRDGTWTQLSATAARATTTLSDYRDNIDAVARTNKRAVKWFAGCTGTNCIVAPRQFHLYGSIAAGETPDRLLYIDEDTSLEFTADKDYGDIPRGSARDFEMRLKNNSGSKTISTISITTEVQPDSGTSNTWYTYSVGGGAFVSNPAIASIGPGSSSSLILVRQIIPDDAQTGLHAARSQTAHTTVT